eukprot:m.248689 g.248689  ORF g.248689 m.248689 type:complete len:111 (-) comp26672_c2_seq7:3030-3362(-)
MDSSNTWRRVTRKRKKSKSGSLDVPSQRNESEGDSLTVLSLNINQAWGDKRFEYLSLLRDHEVDIVATQETYAENTKLRDTTTLTRSLTRQKCVIGEWHCTSQATDVLLL